MSLPPSSEQNKRFMLVVERVKAALEDLQKEKDIFAKVSADQESSVIRVYGEGSDALKRALSALSEILELAYTTAEHHPYWGIIYHTTEISKMALEAWNSSLSQAQADEIEWRTDEIKGTIERIRDYSQQEQQHGSDSHNH